MRIIKIIISIFILICCISYFTTKNKRTKLIAILVEMILFIIQIMLSVM